MNGAAGNDRCPRCGGSFHCGAHDAAPCACSALVLSAELQARLRAQYAGCLCLRCLQAMAASPAPAAPRRADHTTG